MANAIFELDGVATTLTGTGSNDNITLQNEGDNTATYTINAGGGSDTLVFNGVLGVDTANDVWAVGGANSFVYQNGVAPGVADADETVNTTGVEVFQFDNGTVTSNASVTPETLMSGAISQDITTLGVGTAAFDFGTLLEWNGSTVSENAGWSIQSVNGLTSANNALITIVENGVVQGRVTVNGTNTGFTTVTAENAFHTGLDIDEVGTMSIDVVLTNGTETFSQIITVDVVGVASDADNRFVGAETADILIDLEGGDDFAVGNGGSDDILGGAGNDTMYAGASDIGDDTLVGGDDDDILAGGAGNDALVGDGIVALGLTRGTVATDAGTNQLFGGAGDDAIAIGGFNDGAATFTSAALSAAGVPPILVPGVQVGSEGGEAFGGDGNDFIIGTASGDDLVGMGNGNDTVVLGSGDDTVYAGADDTGDDVVVTGNGNNEVYTGAGDDDVTGGTGNDTVGLGAGDDTYTDTLGGGNNSVFAGAGDDTIDTGAGNDGIYGGAGDDDIDAGSGNDTIYGGVGDDDLSGEGGSDTFVFAIGDGNDDISDFNVAGDDMIDFSALGVSGLADLIITDDGANTVIFYGEDDSVTLIGVTGGLDAADFIF